MNYRPEIDGLRALAVIPVIFFHANLEFFNGGFIGVDIFFVISGYLITTILISEINYGKLNILAFYERRARRILPALFFVTLICIPFAWIFMPPAEMKNFSQSLIAVSLFTSNILFWRETNYFTDLAGEKPLLHTWSLAVEEQFYLIFPVFLILFWRFGRNNVFYLIISISLFSLFLAEWGWRNYPVANFYLSPFRAWELLLGSLAAFLAYKNGVKSNNLLSILGIIILIVSVLTYDDTVPTPSLFTLVPITGVLLIIIFASSETFVGKLLAFKPLVLVGLISYSAYLWHQPLFSFLKIYLINKPSEITMFMTAILSFPLAYLSWKYIEQPFRNKNYLTRNKIFIVSISMIILLSSIGFLGVFKNGNISRWNDSVVNYEKLIADSSIFVWEKKNKIRGLKFGNTDNRKILIVGDSKSGDLINILSMIDASKRVSYSSLTISDGCGNLFVPKSEYKDLISKKKRITCNLSDDLFSTDSINLMNNADVVIFASAWKEWEVNFIKKSKIELNKKFGDKFWWFGYMKVQFPSYRERFMNGEINLNKNYLSDKSTRAINDKLSLILNDNFINPFDLFCEKNVCTVIDKNNQILLYDGSHLTKNGAKFFANKFNERYDDLLLLWLNN